MNIFNFDTNTLADKRISTALPVRAYALIKSSDAWVFTAPEAASARLTQLLYGESVTVHEQQGDFYFVQSQLDAYCGWVHGSMLRQLEQLPAATSWCTRFVAPMTREPDMKSPLLAYLPIDSLLYLTGEHENYWQLLGGAWVHKQHTMNMQEKLDIVATARAQIGRSYVWGGRGLGGLDCSALSQLCYRFAGRQLPRDSDLQQKFMHLHHQSVKGTELHAGDLIFVPGHVMIASSPESIIHANGHHMRVVEEETKGALLRMKAQIGDKFGVKAYRWKN